MRLTDKTRALIDSMEKKGYVWLSHLDINTQMRFRNMTKKGFNEYVKVSGPGKNGLTFLTKEVADIVKCGGNKNGKRTSMFDQLRVCKKRIAELEAENKLLRESIYTDAKSERE